MSERPRLQRPDGSAALTGPETLLIGNRPGSRRAAVPAAATGSPGPAGPTGPAGSAGATLRPDGLGECTLAELEARVAAAQAEGMEAVRQAEAQFEADKQTAHTRFAQQAGPALWEIHDRKLYRSTHSTWEEYLGERWGLSRSYAHRLLEMIPVQAALLPNPAFGNLVLRESQARVLVPVLREYGPAQVREVVEKALADGARPTAKALTAARTELGYAPVTVGEWAPGEPSDRPAPAPDLEDSRLALGDLERLAGVLRAALRDLPGSLPATAARGFPDETRAAVADLRRQLRRAAALVGTDLVERQPVHP
ncbi:hypothetical protein [Kitasatospora sp. MBT63]|uniref:hypothetical protein n=1 Tax=Kitasatospora sp. MBT63 TaxID=1444768 RepID=UPI00053ABA64|nr:hypothetical protein [Kitasatospora sp. MBT63]